MSGRRRGWRPSAIAAGVLAALAAGGPAALGAALVNIDGEGRLDIAVEQLGGPDGDFSLNVEPIFTQGRSFRVRAIGLGRPTIASNTTDCSTNFVFNDVVCRIGFRRSITVVAGDGADLLGLIEEGVVDTGSVVPGLITAPPSGCVELGTGTPIPAVVSGGAGIDVVAVLERTSGSTSFFANCPAGLFAAPRLGVQLTADGGAGDDFLSGGAFADTLRGGANSDELLGRAGDDLLDGGGGNDLLDGEEGTDTVTYAAAGAVAVAATIGDDTSGDGPVGEADRILGSVENVIGGAGPDSLIGNGNDNRLEGGDGGDTIRGGGGGDRLFGLAGNDNILGGSGDDSLEGGSGADVLNGQGDRDAYSGGGGDDSITARDGISELVACGAGVDSADVDLQDVVGVSKGSVGVCESVFRFATDDGPPGRVLGRRLRVGTDRTAGLVLSCPRGARVACRGALTLRAPGRRGRVLSRSAYSVPVGRRAPVRVSLAGALPRTVLAETRERGRSTKGPRGSRILLTVGPGRS